MADGRLTFDTKLNSSGLTKGLNSIGSMASKAVKGVAKIGSAAVAAGATASAALVKSAVDSYASYEQLVGGIETLFGAGGQTLEEYAKSVGKSTESAKEDYEQLMNAQTIALENADQAYKTAGMSANDYMETVTSFAASLKQSTENETEAAKVADQAVIDMSDNANKMGTSMELIQNAYQGFAKQNYTMLDNLKLGYGGTKEEMARLLEDAEKLKKAQGENVSYSIDSLADVIEAIHVVQDELGITGTTAKEASTTIEGSVNQVKASWSNLLTGMANENADIDTLIDNFVESVEIALDNIIPVVSKSLEGLSTLIGDLAPIIAEGVPQFVEDIVPELLNAGALIVAEFISALPGMLSKILPALEKAIKTIFQTLANNAPKQFKPIIEVFGSLAENAIPVLKNAFNGLAKVVSTLGTVVSKVIIFFTQNKDAANLLASAIVAITTAVIAYKVAQEASNIISSLNLVWIKLQVAYLALQEGATLKAALAQAELNTVMAANPILLVVSAIAALIAGLTAWNALSSQSTTNTNMQTVASQQNTAAINAETEAIRAQNEELANKIAQTEATIQEDAAHMEYIQNLTNELFELADETGRVKDADKARVDFILNELNSALGTEYELTGNQIGQYQLLQDEIHKTIEAKTAELLLSDAEANYLEATKKYTDAQEEATTALNEREQAKQNVINKELEYSNALKEQREIEKEYEGVYSMDAVNAKAKAQEKVDAALEAIEVAGEEAKQANKNYEKKKKTASEYYAQMIQWQSAYQASAEGNVKRAKNLLTRSVKDFEKIGESITEGVANGMSNKKALKKISEASNKLADVGYNAYRKADKINSPSKRYEWLGKMNIEGLEKPWKDYDPYASLNASLKANKNTLKMNYNAGLSLDGYVDYKQMGNEFVNALSQSGLTVQIGEREFGRVVRKVMI